ncbi:MAG: hypothetical protein ACOX5G_13165 [Kiritimatiellia bacterium]
MGIADEDAVDPDVGYRPLLPGAEAVVRIERDQVVDGIWIDRRPERPDDLPDGTTVCIDLAAELPAVIPVRFPRPRPILGSFKPIAINPRKT